jgi:hypothetical protein
MVIQLCDLNMFGFKSHVSCLNSLSANMRCEGIELFAYLTSSTLVSLNPLHTGGLASRKYVQYGFSFLGN